MQMPRFAAITLLAGTVLAGCSSTPVEPAGANAAAAAPMSAPPPVPATPRAPAPVATSTVTTVSLPPHLDPKSPISTERSVYFDFDVFAVKREYAGMIERHGKYLAGTPGLSIKIEGHADERGGAEYNLALGQKRAQAVLQALRFYGVKDNQMEAISWGRERPRALGHDEAAWAENRRVDLAYPKGMR